MRYLEKIGGVYRVRFRIPKDLKKYFAQAEIRHSLHTGRFAQAKPLLYGLLAETERIFAMIRSGILDDGDIAKMVEKYKREHLATYDVLMDSLAASGGSNVKVARADLSEHFTGCLHAANNILLDNRGLEELTVHVAHSLLKERGEDGVNIASYTPEFKSLCRAVALANKEVYSTLIERNETGDSEYDRAERAKPRSKTLKELIATYHAEKESGWRDPASTKAIHNRVVHIMGDIRLNEIDRDMCIAFRESLKGYPLKNGDFVTPWRELAKRKKKRLSERTQNGTVSELISLFKYAADYGMGINGNPANGLLKSKSDCKPIKEREEYTIEELNLMILELAKIDRVRAPEQFWIPLLLLYTGARANEICMLRCSDIVQDGSNWTLHFRNNAEHNQCTKNSKNRSVPVHSHLIAVGFIDYCNKQREAGKDRLFSNLTLSRGKWNVNYGKQFARTFKRRFLVGYTEKQLTAKDLHTFRVTFITWFVQSGLVVSPVDFVALQSIIGHTDTAELKAHADFMQKMTLTVNGYGGGLTVDPNAFIEHLDYGIDLSPISPLMLCNMRGYNVLVHG